MLSPRAQDLVDRCRRVEAAADAYAQIAGDAWYGSYLPEEKARKMPESCVAVTESVRAVGVDFVRYEADGVVRTDLAFSRAELRYHEACRERDAVAAELYGKTTDLRELWRYDLSRKEEKAILAIAGRTPRQHERLLSWSERIVTRLRWQPEDLPSCLRNLGMSPDVDEIDELCRRLEAAGNAARTAESEWILARDDRREALASCKQTLTVCAGFVEGILDLVGLEDLRFRVRGVRRRGRPRKDERRPAARREAAPKTEVPATPATWPARCADWFRRLLPRR